MTRADSSARPAAPDAGAVTRDRALALYHYMRLTRSIEERLVNLKRQGRIAGGIYRSLGQEAGSVGTAHALEPGDVLCPLIRDLGAILVRGATPVEIFRQNLSRITSPTLGREQSFHFADLERGFLGHVAVLGDMVPVLAGIALSFRLRGEARVALVYSGDGGMSTGAFHEGINFAAVQRVPLVIVCERNGYAYSTPLARQTAVTSLADKAAAYGIPGVSVDGNDALAVREVASAAVARARAGYGATLIELVTYRRLGHAEHDDQRYVPVEEREHWESRDPIAFLGEQMMAEGWATSVELSAMDHTIGEQLTSALLQAEQEPETDPSVALGGLYAR